jgi:hypothetical protein
VRRAVLDRRSGVAESSGGPARRASGCVRVIPRAAATFATRRTSDRPAARSPCPMEAMSTKCCPQTREWATRFGVDVPASRLETITASLVLVRVFAPDTAALFVIVFVRRRDRLTLCPTRALAPA